jgi:signal transduction histidine kinase
VRIVTQTHSESLLYTNRAAALFVLPVCLASWCFKLRGAFLSVAVLLPSLAVLNAFEAGRSLLWPRATPWGFLFGGVSLLALGVVVALMKQALDLSQLARAKAQQAEVRLQQLQLVRNQFLVNVTHELRTPLTQLQGYLDLLNECREQHDAPTQALFLHSALAGCDDLRLQVDNILDAARSTSGMRPPHYELLHIADLIQDVVAHIDPITHEADPVHLECEASLTLWADVQYVRQVLRNLLSNAFSTRPHTARWS